MDNGDACAFQIQHFIVQRQRDLFAHLRERHIVAHKRPFEHGNRPCEHAFHRAFGQALRVAGPINRHRIGARYVAVDDGRFHAAAAVALHPAKLAETIARQLFAKIFHHIVALGFAMHQHVNAQFFLLGNAVGDFFFHRGIVIGSGKLAFFERGAGLADFGGLRERADGGGGQQGQVKLGLLRFDALGKRCTALVCAFGQIGNARLHGGVVDFAVAGAVGLGGIGCG